jgi:hypothetical protein
MAYRTIGTAKLVIMTNLTGARFQAPAKEDAKISGYAHLTGDIDGVKTALRYITIFETDKVAFIEALTAGSVELSTSVQFNEEDGSTRDSVNYNAPESINIASFETGLK